MSKYVSWQPDPTAVHIHALSLTWCDIKGYAFPPFSLTGRVIQKMEEEEADLVLIVPRWPTQPWFPHVMRRLVDVPLILPAGCLPLPSSPT